MNERQEPYDAIRQAETLVAKMPQDAASRELAQRLLELKQAVAEWADRKSSPGERAEVLRQIAVVAAIARNATPTLRRPAAR